MRPQVSATASVDINDRLHISLVNTSPWKEEKVRIDIGDFVCKHIKGEVLTSDNMQAHNTFTNPDKVKPEKITIMEMKKGMVEITIPKLSIVTLELW